LDHIKFTYKHSNCSRRLLPPPRQCGCLSCVGPFIGHISETAVHVGGKHLHGNSRQTRQSLSISLCFYAPPTSVQIQHSAPRSQKTLLYRVFLKCFDKLQQSALPIKTKKTVHINIYPEMSGFECTGVLPYPWVIRPKTYRGYVRPRIIPNAIYNVILV
jgi:hypothetical protein